MNSYDDFSETFANSRKNMKWPEMEYFCDFIKAIPNLTNPDIKVLDVGCGNGRLLNYLKEL